MNAQQMAHDQLHAKLTTLTVIGRAIATDSLIDEDTEQIAAGGVSPWEVLHQLVLEAKTPKSVAYTDFMLSLGGPTVWLRHTTARRTQFGIHPEQWFLCATAKGMGEPEELALNGRDHNDALIACEQLWDDRVCPY